MKMKVSYCEPNDRLQRPHHHVVEVPDSCNERAVKNHSQSLVTLNNRGGVDVMELYGIMNDLSWRETNEVTTMTDAIHWLKNSDFKGWGER